MSGRFSIALLILALFASPVALADDATQRHDLFDHELRRLHSDDVVNLREHYAGHPLLVVNTASYCGFTRQFEGLEALHRQYRDAGLKVIGFPSNDFRQEASDESETAEICYANYGVSFDMFSPIRVTGPDAHPVFRELARQSDAPRWNFHKYVIDRTGRVIAAFPSRVEPDSAELKAAIERVL